MPVFESHGIRIDMTDNSRETIEAMINSVDRGLRVCGEKAVGYAKDLVPIRTGDLKNSITYKVESDECYIGTNVEYAPYVEFGTGIYSDMGGRHTEWVTKNSNGVFVTHKGSRPYAFLRPSVSGHQMEYLGILRQSMENA